MSRCTSSCLAHPSPRGTSRKNRARIVAWRGDGIPYQPATRTDIRALPQSIIVWLNHEYVMARTSMGESRKRPVVLIILDGWGIGRDEPGNAVLAAKTP